MSPEQIRGSDSLDRRADVYAFGVILYEALTGQVPFIADTYGALVLEIATGTPKTPDELVPGLPVALSRVVMRAMARNAQDRFADLESLIHALEPFLHDTVPTREPTGSKKRFRSSGNSPMSTPFTAEPPPEDPSLLGLPNGRSAMYIALAIVAVGIIWFAFEKLRAPEIPMLAPGPIHATQPDLAAPPPSAAPAPASGTATLPSGASTPPSADSQPFQQQPSSNTTSMNAASDTAPKAKPPVAAAKSGMKVHPKSAKPEGSVEQAQPSPPAQPEKAEKPGRRARSGPLSVDEF
jgi:serine/threonine-protein kinase